jgi:hypothetical protein
MRAWHLFSPSNEWILLLGQMEDYVLQDMFE